MKAVESRHFLVCLRSADDGADLFLVLQPGAQGDLKLGAAVHHDALDLAMLQFPLGVLVQVGFDLGHDVFKRGDDVVIDPVRLIFFPLFPVSQLGQCTTLGRSCALLDVGAFLDRTRVRVATVGVD